MLNFLILHEEGPSLLLPEDIFYSIHPSLYIPIFPNLDKQAQCHVKLQASHVDVPLYHFLENSPEKIHVLIG